MAGRFGWFSATSVTLGFAFLYLPILILIAFSFNESRLVTVWAGFSTKWYGEVLSNKAFLDAAWVTLKVALISSTVATVLGTLAAYALVRFTRFTGRTLFAGMVSAPLVMPEVITGLSLLLLFIALDIARGVTTIILAHITFSMAFATVVISSRLGAFDRTLEDAGRDLGCTPLSAFFTVTLPVIAPAVIAAWLLAFTLSLDDLVIASFTSGPGSTTLPMQIYSSVRLGVSPEINALSSMLIGLVTVGVVIASIVSARAERRRAMDERAADRAADPRS
ncbi:MAG: ABC transporter permease subunit [Pseudomonadota bacterium]